MESITDEFRFYPLPDDIGHHNVIQLNPEGADERRENVRVFSVASQGHPNDLDLDIAYRESEQERDQARP